MFSDLEKLLESLNPNSDASLLLRLWDGTKWALKDSDICRILGNLQIGANMSYIFLCCKFPPSIRPI